MFSWDIFMGRRGFTLYTTELTLEKDYFASPLIQKDLSDVGITLQREHLYSILFRHGFLENEHLFTKVTAFLINTCN